jgi:exodeoxyribonuclease V gamma subunit
VLRVVYSNRSGELAAALCEALPADGDPFACTHVVVPGRLVARWVQYAVASRRGIAAQLDLRFLETFLADAFTGDAAARAAGLTALDRPRFAAVVASALADEALIGAPDLARVADYLAEDDAGARAVRRVQLAGRLATLFWDYCLTRPDWIDAWDADRPIEVADAAAAGWQSRLWHAAMARLALTPGTRWAPVPRLPRVRRRLGLGAPPLAAPVHVIGFSYLARAYLDAFDDLATTTDVTIYLVNPCAEFWEDVPDRVRPRTTAPRRAAHIALADTSFADLASDPAALRLWGRPARDTVAALVDRTAGDFAARFVDPGEPTALHAMLRDVLARSPAERAAAPPADAGVIVDARDAGVTVLACPSLTRELEIVGGEIARLLAADPGLRASDIAVLVAGGQAERYLAQLPAVFQSVAPTPSGAGGLPFHIVDLPLAEHGRVAEGALLLLEVPLGRFTRPELLGLMTHPAVLARHPHVDPDDWVRWADRLGVVHGAGKADHAGTYLADIDLFHWDQGVRRLALGAFMAGARSGDDGLATVGESPCLPEEIAPDLQASAATFALLTRSLIADATWLRGQHRTFTEWAGVLDALVASYLGATTEQAERELARVRRDLARLAELDLDGRAIGYAEVVEVVRGRLGAMRGDRGEPLADGVMVAPLAPMRPLPARVVFCVGLAEGRFPAGDAPSPLDLRHDVRRGDVPLRDRDRYAFFEALLAARDRVFLSYVALDAKSGEALAPSSVVVELADAVAPYLGVASAPDALQVLTVVHPLRRWSTRYLHDERLTAPLAPSVGRERWAARTRDLLIDHLRRTGGAVPEPAQLRRLFAEADHAGLRRALGLDATDGVAPAAGDDAPIVLSLATLRRFLESPIQAWAQAVLRLDDDDDEDLIRREDEPFGTGSAERAGLLRDAFALHLGATGDAACPVDAAYDAALRRRLLAGHAPVGVFGDAERQRDLETLTAWSAELDGTPSWRRVAFGRASAPGCQLGPPIVLAVEVAGHRRRVELIGQTELLGEGGVGSLILSPSKPQPRHDLRGAFDHLALTAAGLRDGEFQHVVLSRSEDPRRIQHAPWRPDDARAYLTDLAGALLGERHAYLLSLKIASDVIDGKPARLDKPSAGLPGTLGYGPVSRDGDLDLPPDWRARVARHWEPVLGRMIDPSARPKRAKSPSKGGLS